MAILQTIYVSTIATYIDPTVLTNCEHCKS